MQYYPTVQLARQHGCLETIWVNRPVQALAPAPRFPFAIVLDFEATCWENSTFPFYRDNEIIEFSGVLYCVRTRSVLAEFQQYVTPTEKPALSEFCTKLTGIGQEQVDKGIPLPQCLDLYCKWHCEQCVKYRIAFGAAEPFSGQCAFVTWTNADLGMFLERECRRKGIFKPPMFNQWIDIKAIYCEFYQRKPMGLKGALHEVGLQFEGKEHSGLDDAKNTARLLGHMASQNAPLYINGVR